MPPIKRELPEEPNLDVPLCDESRTGSQARSEKFNLAREVSRLYTTNYLFEFNVSFNSEFNFISSWKYSDNEICMIKEWRSNTLYTYMYYMYILHYPFRNCSTAKLDDASPRGTNCLYIYRICICINTILIINLHRIIRFTCSILTYGIFRRAYYVLL